MATVTYTPATPVQFSTLNGGNAYTVEDGAGPLFRKVGAAERLSENSGQLEPEDPNKDCYLVAESRISITVAP